MNIFEALKQEYTEPPQIKDIEEWETYMRRIFQNEDLDKMYDVKKSYCNRIKEAFRHRFAGEYGKYVRMMCEVQKEMEKDKDVLIGFCHNFECKKPDEALNQMTPEELRKLLP